MSLEVGLAAEQTARNYLVQQGLKWVTSNYRCRWGEVDLIFWDDKHLVFVEVRARMSSDYGSPLESVTWQKQSKIIKTATHYMVVNKLYERCNARFDVISMQGPSSSIDWIKNAFDAGC